MEALDGVNQKAAEIIEEGIDMGPPTPEDLDDVCALAPFPFILILVYLSYLLIPMRSFFSMNFEV
jgi:hypothetical protein